MKITKIFTFHAAHRLTDYNGKCFRLHGHTYRVELTVEGFVDESDMVYDFGNLKKLFEKYVKEDYDHKLILYDKDPLNIKISKGMPKDWIFWFPCNPTAEAMASDINYRIAPHLPRELTLSKVRVWETPTAYAELEK